MSKVNGLVVLGDQNVIRDLFHEKVLGSDGRYRKRFLAVSCGGKAGIVTAAELEVFSDRGIKAGHFNYGVGNSAGANNITAFAAGQANLVRPVYEQLHWGNWGCLKSLLLHGDAFGLIRLREILEEKLDVEALRKCAMDLYIAASDREGNLILYRLREAKNIFAVLYASSAIYPLARPIKLDGEMRIDGGESDHPYPIRQAVHRALRGMGEHGEVDILFLSNKPLMQKSAETWAFNLLVNLTLFLYPKLRRNAMALDERLAHLARMFERAHKRFRVCAIFPSQEHYILMNEWRPGKLKKVGDAVYRDTEILLNDLRPAREV